MLVQVSRDSALPCNQSESAKITLKVFLEMMPAGIVSNTKTSKKAKPKEDQRWRIVPGWWFQSTPLKNDGLRQLQVGSIIPYYSQ